MERTPLMSVTLENILEAARQLPPTERRELAERLLAETPRTPLSAEEIERNLAIVDRTWGTIKGLDRETIISIAEDEEYCGY
jgi:hypothetical protein